jgi:hypothetical protein
VLYADVIMTPYELSFLIHIRTSPSRFPLAGTELYENVVFCFEETGVIEKAEDTESGWQLTKLGVAWLEVILHVPMPKTCFVDYAGNVVAGV